ncbi:SMI1/KNR4 family protein [Solirubrobacter soli]|uniref:SMI1/KNR4 family protein n=1 Tax=Solirubrobacter soli TaxID=363832 RepID=UPI000415FC5D|nr:SMI1/KNR4 family protein [Solirubrobacter soli]
MRSGEAPRLRVVAGGGLSGGAIGGGGGARLRAVGYPRESHGGGGGAFDWRAELELVAPDVLLPPGCSRHALAAAEGSLGLRLSPELAEFLGATDGIYDIDSHHWYAWSLERLVDENFEAERPRDLLLVGDDAGSGWFCLPLQGTGALHYNRITAQRRTVARDLRGLWLGWFGGTLGV